jgi:N-acetylneuraminic acid mutarotase
MALSAAAQTTAPNEWTWMGGDEHGGQPGVYGTLGTPAATNVPGSRNSAVTWTDGSGNLWLFGGYNGDIPSDLWEFNPSTNEWTWMGGSNNPYNFPGQPGVYGTLGVPAAGNIPSGRYSAAGWTDSSAKFWLFGGEGVAVNGLFGYLNDLWEYNPATNQWAWMSGSSTLTCVDSIDGYCGAPGQYHGTPGTYTAGNVPTGRFGAMSWTDSKGMLWLFGGMTGIALGDDTYLNDLWQFNPSTSQWVWMGGDSAAPCPASAVCSGASGVYGTLGTPSAANMPGAREFAATWTDTNGNLWLFGGYGADSTGAIGNLNDLWKFETSTSEWTWVGGGSTFGGSGGSPGVYGTWMTPAAGNQPGGRQSATSWTDNNGNFWLYGGLGMDSAGVSGALDDLWEFNPSTSQWAWMSGSEILTADWQGQPGVYGTLQTPVFLNTPGGRYNASSWTGKGGNLWLFGGYGFDVYGSEGSLNDLWEYQPTAGSLPVTATPSFSLNTGSYPSQQAVTISDATTGASIYYFINGSAAATQYIGGITVTSTETIEAVAVAQGYAESAVATATYTMPVAATPTFSPPGGTYSTTQTVTIADATPGAIIYYALNEAPTRASNVYSGAITVSGSETIEAMAVASDYTGSATAAANYSIWPASALNEWAWMGGNDVLGLAVYGTLGTPAVGNIPGIRNGAATWTDKSGNFWLFGGLGYDAHRISGYLNDLWEFNPSANEWAWMGGNSTMNCVLNTYGRSVCNEPGVYGTLGTPAAANIPGGRYGAVSWTDKSGNFWLFGGQGYDANGYAVDITTGILNDLWEFNPSTGQWAWMGGSNSVGDNCFLWYSPPLSNCAQPGIYGTLGTPAAGNIPGGRTDASAWVDSKGNFWLFGGWGFDIPSQSQYFFNDVWEFSPSTNQWAWMGGSSSLAGAYCFFDSDLMYWPDCGQAGVYGTLKAPSAGNIPGGRSGATGWTDGNGNFWLIGGWGWDANGNFGNEGYPDDFWEFTPSKNEWTWMGGSSTIPQTCTFLNDTCNSPAIPGSLGTPAAANFPGPRYEAASWTDLGGHLWLFGGGDAPNDLWEFYPSTTEWAWMGGNSPATCTPFCLAGGVYGTLGVPAAGDVPDGSYSAAYWTDSSGNFWLFSGDPSEPAISGDSNTLWVYRPANGSFPVTATPTFSVPAGTYTTPQTVTISDATSAPTIYYTTDGTTPTTSSSAYSGPITLSSTETLQAIATAAGFNNSAVASATYTINLPPPDFSVADSPALMTVNAGSSGTTTVSVTPANGFNAAVSFACSGLPSGASCSFSPSTVTPSGTAASTTTLTVATPSATATLRSKTRSPFPGTVLALLFCCFSWKKRRSLLALLVLTLCLGGLGLLTACGGGASGGGPPPIQPVTSTITVTATSGALSHSTTFSLTVN